MKNLSFFERNHLIIKGCLIGFLILILMIPTVLIENLIRERQNRKMEVVQEISNKWGSNQSINGPILKIPVDFQIIKSKETEANKTIKNIEMNPNFIFIAPEHIKINAALKSEKRSRGIFEVVVYQSDLQLKGNLKDIVNKVNKSGASVIHWEKAEILLGISDLKGLKNSTLKINDKNFNIERSEKISNEFGNAVVADIDLTNLENLNFDLNLKVNGSQNLKFVPIAQNNQVIAKSDWENPSFDGEFLPESRVINKTGFEAKWQISQLNRNLPNQWLATDSLNFKQSAFGLNLINPNDNYQQAMRSAKYAILIISLSFLVFFFTEILLKHRFHLFQYVLVGFALVIFYTLLVSISELLVFSLAYLISAILTIGLIYFYTQISFKNNRYSFVISLILSVLYAFIYVIIQLEDTSLLIGSLGLFLILAIIMKLSSKIDWYPKDEQLSN